MTTTTIVLTGILLILFRELVSWILKTDLQKEKHKLKVQRIHLQWDISKKEQQDYIEKEKLESEQLKNTYETEENERLSLYHKKLYGELFVERVTELIDINKEILAEAANSLAPHFLKPPSHYPRKKLEEILLSVPTIVTSFKVVGRGLIGISCEFNISIHEILTFIITRYNYSELIIVPLDIVCSNGIQMRNEEIDNSKWLDRISTPELILSIANQKVKENFSLLSQLDSRFKSRMKRVDMTSTFNELYIMYRKLETYKEFRLKNNLDVDKYTESILETIDQYHQIYKEYVEKAV